MSLLFILNRYFDVHKYHQLAIQVFIIFLLPLLLYAETQPSNSRQILSPRASLEQFLTHIRKGNFESAQKFVELPNGLSETLRSSKLMEIAKEVNRLAEISPILLSTSDAGNLNDSLPVNQDLLVEVVKDEKKIQIFLERVSLSNDPDIESLWRLPYSQVKQLLSLDKTPKGSFKIESLFPQWTDINLFGLFSLTSSLGFLLIALTALLVTYPIRLLVTLMVRYMGDAIYNSWCLVCYQVQLFLATRLTVSALSYLELSFTTRQIVDRILFVISSVLVLWIAVKSTGMFISAAKLTLLKNGKESDTPFLPLIQRFINIFITISIILFVVNQLGFDVTTILAGLGVGGIAIALASQKTIENLFGGLVLFLDQPVAVGQFGKFGDIVGTIEDIGLRSTKIRTIQRTKISIPNASLIGLNIENFSVREKILFMKNLTLAVNTTVEQLIYITGSIRELFIAHKMVLPDPARVKLVDVTASGMSLEMYCYIDTSDWGLFLNIQEDLWLRILSIVRESGAALASMPDSIRDAVDVERRDMVKHQVNQWRAENVLPLPDLPPDEVAKRRNTIEYPPKESWLGKYYSE
jgi:MscS family membrane protein